MTLSMDTRVPRGPSRHRRRAIQWRPRYRVPLQRRYKVLQRPGLLPGPRQKRREPSPGNLRKRRHLACPQGLQERQCLAEDGPSPGASPRAEGTEQGSEQAYAGAVAPLFWLTIAASALLRSLRTAAPVPFAMT